MGALGLRFILALLLHTAPSPPGELCVEPKQPDFEPVPPKLRHKEKVERLRNGKFMVQVDDRPPLAISETRTVCVKGLAFDAKHLVRMRSNGEAYASFHFTFAEKKSSRLLLSYTDGYGTWVLDPMDEDEPGF